MKKHFKFLPFVLLGCCLVFNSCSENDNSKIESISSKNSNLRYIASDFEYIGIEHNRIITNYFNKLDLNNFSNYQEYTAYTNLFIQTDLETFQSVPEDFNLANEIISHYGSLVDIVNEDLYSFINPDLQSQLSSNVKNYLDVLYDLLIDENSSPRDITNKIEKLEDSMYQDPGISNKDLSILYSATNIAKHSYKYWYSSELLNQSLSLKSGGRRAARTIGAIALADVAGGVGAAAATWAINVFAPPPAGQAAYGAAIIGGAVRTSVTVGVTAIAGAIFDLW